MQRWSRLPIGAMAAAAQTPGSVLLETTRFGPDEKLSYLFLNPIRVLEARRLDETRRVFAGIEEALAQGLYVAGFFAYECGYHFEPTAAPGSSAAGDPLIWLGVYERPILFDHERGAFRGNAALPVHEPQSWAGALVTDRIGLEISDEDYCSRILSIKEYIRAGESYQVNFTDRVRFKTGVSTAEIYRALTAQQSVAYGGFLNMGESQILSFSPELFFRIRDGRIVTRPMKGTMPRGLDSAEDAVQAESLRNDEKNRAEHVMIVDLLRNDLGRICTMGSVRVENLFTVERYQTLLQMTSTIAGQLRPEVGFYEIFRALFPCGSVTGAPKVRTMGIIREMELTARGVYSGAIGFIAPDRSAVFNVAIRTLVVKGGEAVLGVGGGIVADSDPVEERNECLLKASFVTRSRYDFQLIETMLWDEEFPLRSLHLDRLSASASYFDFVFDREEIQARIMELGASLGGIAAPEGELYRVRLLLAPGGEVTLTAQAFHSEPPRGFIRFASERTLSTDVFFRHKTTRREFYDRQHDRVRTVGLDDVLFLNERGEVTEGAISNVFVELGGKLLTPPLRCGVLNGVYRRHLLENREGVEERVLTVDDLRGANAIYLCNAVRGIWAVKLMDEG